MEKPVFILGSHKSGTTLLRNLFDRVPGFFVLPIEMHLFEFTGYWVDYALRKVYPKKLTFEEVVDKITEHIKKSNETANPTSDSILKGMWNVERFKNHLRATGHIPYLERDMRGFFNAYIESVHVALYGSYPVAHRFVEKSIENAEYATHLFRLYPDAFFIHLIRDPYATLVSIRKHIISNTGSYPYLASALSSMNNSYYYSYKNPSLIHNYQMVRYEDLVSDPEKVMRSLAELIGITYSEVLLQPSFQGNPWHGNSTSGVRFTGISPERITAWKNEITVLEAQFIRKLFPHILRDHFYAQYTPHGSFLSAAPHEKIQIYLANRLLWLIINRTGQLA
jgi:hypothetical protein